jgi:hypothetical protein
MAQLSQYGQSVILQNNSGSAAANGAPNGGVFLFASGAVGSAKLFMNKEGSASDLELGSLKVEGDSGAETIAAGETLTIAGGTGLDTALSSGTITFSMDLNELAAASVNVGNDSIAIIDADDSNGSKKESIADLATAMAGVGIAASSGQFVLDISEISDVQVASGDKFLMLDSDDSTEQLESVDDLATFMAGDGLAASSGVLAVQVGSNKGLALTSDALEITGSAVADGTIAIGTDTFMFFDSDGSVKEESFTDLSAAQAGAGLAAASGVLAVANASDGGIAVNANDIAVDLNDLAAAAVAVDADSIAIIDATDDGSKKESIADLMTAVAGDGLAASSGVLAVQVGSNKGLALTSDALEITGSAVTAAAVAIGTDTFMFFDADGSVKEESFVDLSAAQAGAGLAAASGVLAVANATNGGVTVNANDIAVNLDDLAAAAVDVGADSIAILDATDDGSKKESIADLATAMAGDGLAASSGVFAVQVGTNKGLALTSDALEITGSAVADGTIAVGTDTFMFFDADGSVKEESIVDLVAGIIVDDSGLDASSGQLSVDVSDFLANGVNNRLVTATGADAMNSEANLTFDGSTLTVAGAISGSGNVTIGPGRLELLSSPLMLKEGSAASGIANSSGQAVFGISSGQNGNFQSQLNVTSHLTIASGYSSGGSTLTANGSGSFAGDLIVGTSGDDAGGDVQFHGDISGQKTHYSGQNNILQVTGSAASGLQVSIGGKATSEFAVDVANGSNNNNKMRAAAFVTYSDESLKSDVASMSSTALDTVMSLEGVEFTWKDSGERDFGFIAQDVQNVLPKAVHTAGNGVQGVDYSRLTSVLVEAVKAQQVQIEELKALLKK